MKKLLLSLVLLGGFLLSFSTFEKVYAAEEVPQGWVKEDGNVYFYDKYGNKLYGKIHVDGKMYYMDLYTGVMITNSWIKEPSYNDYDGNTYYTWYYANSNGELKTESWYLENGKWYYFDEVGMMVTGLNRIGNKHYYFDPSSGAMKKGWIKIINQFESYSEVIWFYASSNGELLTNKWFKDGSNWYYFDDGGIMATDFRDIGGKTYYFDPNTGAMRTGWIKVAYEYGDFSEEYWCYANSSGEIYLDKWLKDGSNWYYFNSWGEMVTGLKYIDKEFYVFHPNGQLSKGGWLKYEDEWYYTNKDGTIATGWKQINGKWYYFAEYSGFMLTGVFSSHGKHYYLNEDGSWYTKQGWLEDKYGNWYYVNGDGTLKTGWTQINGTWYYFNPYYAYLQD